MKTHLIHIKYSKTNLPSVFMARSFTRKEILEIASEICEKFDNIYYDELKTTFICKSASISHKVMRHLINKYVHLK